MATDHYERTSPMTHTKENEFCQKKLLVDGPLPKTQMVSYENVVITRTERMPALKPAHNTMANAMV